jgi:hypothetical protein
MTMNLKITKKTEDWLYEIDEKKCAKIIQSGLISMNFSDVTYPTEFEEWCIYSAQIRVSGKYYKLLETSLKEEKKIIEHSLSKVAEQENIVVNWINWSINLKGRNPRSDNQENKTIDGLKKEIKKLNLNVQEQIDNGLDLYIQEKYISSARILYPSIEEVANIMLRKKGENPRDRNRYKGLYSKIEKLKAFGHVSSDLAEAIQLHQITKPRNSILHGMFNPKKNELTHPTCVLIFTYLKDMVIELNNM